MNQTNNRSNLPAHLGGLVILALTGQRTRMGQLRLEQVDASETSNLFVMTEAFTNDLMVSLWVDTGDRTALLALGLASTRQITVTPRYQKTGQQLSAAQLRQLFDRLFDHSETVIS